MVNKGLLLAGILLPLGLLGEMCFHLRELNKLVKMTVSDGYRNLNAVSPPPILKDDPTGKPLFVLHLGPGKTGTTSIQWAAANHVELLRQNNIHFLGNFNARPDWNLHDMFRICYDPSKSQECRYKWEDFKKIVDHHYSRGHNVFVSEEMITGFRNEETEQEHLWKYLEPLLSKWHVRVIFTYRRFNQWIPSKYHQAFAPSGSNVHQDKRQNWPGKGTGGKPTPTFSNYFDYLLEKERFTFPHAIKRRWEKHFSSNIRVFNMHQEGDLLENFFCQTIPEASLICLDLGEERKKKEQEESSNESNVKKNSSTEKALHFDMLAVRAYQNGWVHKNLTRTKVAERVKTHAETLGFNELTDFDLECFSESQTEVLLARSLSFEKEMVPEYYFSHQGEKALKAEFAEDEENGKFCSIDVEASFKNEPRWRTFFQQLNPSNINEIPKPQKTQKKNVGDSVKIEKERKIKDSKLLKRQEKEEIVEEGLAEKMAEGKAAGTSSYEVPKDFFDNYRDDR